MPINAVLDVSEESPLYMAYEEPVTVEEFKNYAKIDTTDDDVLIAGILISSRETIEKYLGVSIVQKNLTVIVNNEDGGIELPYGPTPGIVDVTTIYDINGDVVNESIINIIGTNFKYIDSPCYPYLKLSYTAGYVPASQALTAGGVALPEAIKFAIMAEGFFRYENRGERLSFSAGGARNYQVSYICDAAKQYCNKYKRNTELDL